MRFDLIQGLKPRNGKAGWHFPKVLKNALLSLQKAKPSQALTRGEGSKKRATNLERRIFFINFVSQTAYSYVLTVEIAQAKATRVKA